uniref:Cyclotide glopa C n=1 Tax=Gloeospermum pauciflorum TaxID=685569 RepID=CYGPC_GLOPU|nr:RecName: Full=Cyclotide glopa C [Gloeospermum pauciflorum]
GDLPICGETCFEGGNCRIPGCTCVWPFCSKN